MTTVDTVTDSIDFSFASSPEQIRAAFAVFGRAMLGLDFGRFDPVAATEPGRYLIACDGDRVVGGVDSYTTDMAVPGGTRLAHAAVTHVGVLPSHRRRGIVTQLMRRQLDDAAARGIPVATLRASEAVIYGHFGYGVAGSTRALSVDLTRTGLIDLPAAPGSVRLADDVDVAALAQIHARENRPGATGRSTYWWDRVRENASTDALRYVAVHATDGVDDGYVVYHPLDGKNWWSTRRRTVEIIDLVAPDPGTHRALWSHVFSLDLVDRIEMPIAPLDDPLPHYVADRRAVELGPVRDEIWLRLIDVEAALAARAYGGSAAVVVGVTDRLRPQNDGAYEIGPTGARRVDSAPDVRIDVADLASVYLGGTRWWQLAAAGRANGSTDAIGRLDTLFATDREPFSGTMF